MIAWLLSALSSFAGEPRIVKVLPHLLDLKGRNALNPSLFERDAYQAYLRLHPDEIGGFRFDVQVKAKNESVPLLLKVELRTANTPLGKVRVFEQSVHPSHWFSTWVKVPIDKKTNDEMGNILAWRATLWRNSEKIAEQDSFLW
jgi:hypothetical protein